ncbi:transposon ty3-I gag-pol polyprotein [Tanacetum coccineum]
MGSMRILNAIKAKTEVPKVVRKGLQYVEATINSVKVRALVDSGATHNFVADDEAKRLGINATKGSGTIKAVLEEFKDVMPKELPKKIPHRSEVDHTIESETGSKPPAKSPYRMPPPELEELRKQLKELMDAGGFRPSKSPYVTIKNKYPIPLIADLFDQLGKARYFTKLDLRSGYYQVRIAEGDEAKTTCVTRYGSYEFLVMPFGLTNAPATFFTLMNKLFHLFLDNFVVVYLDGIVVYSHTLEEHVLHLKQVFQVLRDNELYVKLEKCSFAQDEVEFLGHKIKDGGLMMDGAKIKAIQDCEPPTKVTKLRSFLGLVNYYRRVPSGVREFEEGSYGGAGVETTRCDHAFQVTHGCIGLCYWRSSNARWKPDCIREPKVKWDGKEVHGARERDDGDCPLLEDLEALFVGHALSRKAVFAAITQTQFFLQDRIKEGLEHDPLPKKIIALAKDGRTQRFWLKGDMLFTKGDRLYVPKWGDLRRAILKECHDSKWAGHPGITRTLALVEGTYYWPRMGDDVETFVRTCLICQQDKIKQKKPGGFLEPLPMPKGP